MTKHKHTVLYYAERNPKSLKIILERYSEKDRLEAVKVANNNGNTVLDHPAQLSPESLKAILELVPEKDRLSLFKMKTKKGSV